MKNIFVCLFLLLFICSCSDNSDDIIPEKENNNNSNRVTLRLKAKQQEGNLLDMVDFYIAPKESYTMLDINEAYDSILWRIQDQKGTFKLLEHTNNSSHFVFSWGHSFYVNGHYSAIMDGFKDGNIISSDTLEIEIKNKRDFLNINWADITSSNLALRGNNNVFNPDFNIFFSQSYKDQHPSVYVHFLPNNKIYNDDIKKEEYYTKKQEQLILKYISEIYGEPELSFAKDNATVTKEYSDRFKQADSSFTPRYIWKTQTSHIALVTKYSELDRCDQYYIYAEPMN